jgi:hypothetical protein
VSAEQSRASALKVCVQVTTAWLLPA